MVQVRQVNFAVTDTWAMSH